MAYLDDIELKKLGFKSIGTGVRISDKCSIYNPECIDLGSNCRIDDYCIISGNVSIGNYCHITPMCLIAGGHPGVHLSDFVTLAYGVKIFSQSDDYSGSSMVNSLIPKKFKNEFFARVSIGRQVIIGANSVVLPGVVIGEGCSFGAMSLVLKSTQPWGIYVGQPVRRIRERSKDLIQLEQSFLRENENTI
jgi:acetyltransferase-like isoleucine patch superfamily enzyme